MTISKATYDSLMYVPPGVDERLAKMQRDQEAIYDDTIARVAEYSRDLSITALHTLRNKEAAELVWVEAERAFWATHMSPIRIAGTQRVLASIDMLIERAKTRAA